MERVDLTIRILERTFKLNESNRCHKYRQEKRRPRNTSPSALARVTRDLFGVTRDLFGHRLDVNENAKFVEEQLFRQAEIQKEIWNFDFSREVPVGKHNGYHWQKEEVKQSNKKPLITPRRLRSGVKDYATVRKSGESTLKKRVCMLESIENLKDIDQQEQQHEPMETTN